MKTLARSALAALLLAAAAAHADEQPPEAYTLLTPDSPAFTLLGVSPTQIQRPTDPTALAHSLSEAFTSEGGFRIPTNFALEFAPFWLFAQPELTLTEYQAASLKSLYRKLSISLAITPSQTSETPYPRLGLGLRTRLLDGAPADTTPCQEVLSRYAVEQGQFIAALEPAPTTAEALQQAQQTWLAQNKDRLQQALSEQRCVEVASAREGLLVDLALAGAADFPRQELQSLTPTAAAAWLNAAWVSRELSAIALGRFQVERPLEGAWERHVDTGLRLLWAREDFALSAEGLLRLPVATEGAQARHRVALIGDFQVHPGIWLSLSAGNGFNGAVDYTDFFAVGNIKVFVGDQRRIRWEDLLAFFNR